MEQIMWTDKFSVGVAQLDAQHKTLIAMVNRLLSSPEVTTRSETISDLLSDMTDYARTHFRTEEELMRQHGYPMLDEQIAQHRSFRKKAVDFCTATTLAIDEIPDTMLNYLREWLLEHILTVDMQYKPFFEEQGLT